MDAVSIDDADDPRVAEFRQLTSATHRRQVEAPGPFHGGLFVVEGWLPLERLLQKGKEAGALDDVKNGTVSRDTPNWVGHVVLLDLPDHTRFID